MIEVAGQEGQEALAFIDNPKNYPLRSVIKSFLPCNNFLFVDFPMLRL